jgi:hypothetical protein
LLGLAGLAIAAALGIACQKRILGTAAERGPRLLTMDTA